MRSSNPPLFIHGGVVYTPGRALPGAGLLIAHGRITAIGRKDEVAWQARALPNVQEIDVEGRLVAPGFVDLQVNGIGGRLFMEERSAEGLLEGAAALPRFGCTAFLPTILSAPHEATVHALRAIADAAEAPVHGARVLGAHLEGPFLNPERAGAHCARFIRPPSVAELRRLCEAARGSIRLLTLAPEMPGAGEVITEARKLGIAVAIGHSQATFDQIREAEALGASLVTHLFNAQGALSAREPGVIGAALSSDHLAVSLIADGVHVHPSCMQLALRAKGASRVVLVTDAMPLAGSGAGEFQFYGERVVARDSACFLPDGRLAGSLLTTDQAVRTIRRLSGASLRDALGMASSNPARVLGLQRRLGHLRVGAVGDLTIFDEALRIWVTIVDGEIVYRAQATAQTAT